MCCQECFWGVMCHVFGVHVYTHVPCPCVTHLPHAVRPVGADVEHDEADPPELAQLARLQGHVHHAQARGGRPVRIYGWIYGGGVGCQYI